MLEFVVRHGYALLFLWVLAEQGGLPIPSGPLLLACGALARDGRLSGHWIILTGLAACAIADSIWFGLGRLRGVRILRLICRLTLEADSCVRDTEKAFARYGLRALLISKYVPGLSAVSAPLAAISGASYFRFLIYDTLGSLIWVLGYGSLGFIFRNQLDLVVDYAARMGSWFALLLVALLAAWIGWKFIARQRFLKQLIVSRVTAEALRAKLESGEPVLVVDVRTLLESETDAVPGALRIPLEDMETRHADIPRDRDIILFCS